MKYWVENSIRKTIVQSVFWRLAEMGKQKSPFH